MFCNCWVTCMVNIIWKRIAGKLRIIILLQFGLVTFRCHYGKDRKPSFSGFRDFRTCPWLPKTNHFYFWRNQDTSINSREAPNHLKYQFGESQNQCVWKFWKIRGPNNHEDLFLIVLKILNTGSISSRKHEMKFW